MKNLRLTLKAWPMITIVTIGLCFLTQLTADVLGIALSQQPTLKYVKDMAGWNLKFAKIVAFVLLFAPVVEELLFREILWRLPAWIVGKIRGTAPRSHLYGIFPVVLAIIASALFVSAHYLDQTNGSWRTLDNSFVALFFFGLAQCWLYRRAGGLKGIWCPMLNHLLFNLTNLVLIFTPLSNV